MMDKTEGRVMAGIPAAALTLTLTRSTIKMLHPRSWAIDKTNAVHDLIIALEGGGDYLIGGEVTKVRPGDAMLIPANTPFIGQHAGEGIYRGVAQHFTLELFGRDLIARMHLQRKIRLKRWSLLAPLAEHYYETAPPSSTTLMQHHLFMVLLIDFIEEAFVDWRPEEPSPVASDDRLSMAIAIAATRITADPLADDTSQRAVEAAPYNPDYFKREFRRQIGFTPAKYQEFKRMERAMALLESGSTISGAAAAVGYEDVYYFSRMFRRYVGDSPSGYKRELQMAREGRFPRGEEDGQRIFPLAREAGRD